jgi:hypothetical protein
MVNKEIRRLNLLGLCDKHGRDIVSTKCGYSDVNYLNQLISKNVTRTTVGDSVARKIEKAFKFKEGWMDWPHPEIWPEAEVKKAISNSDDQISLAYDAADPSRQESVRVLLGLDQEQTNS